MAGAPSIYSEELAATLCERIAGGESLRAICADEEMPSMRTVMKWLSDDKHVEFVQQYTRAREIQAETIAEEILAIADDGRNDKYKDDDGREIVDHDVIARSRLRVDARKWLASKMAPKKYGDKLELGGDIGINRLSDEQVEAKLAALLAKAQSEVSAE